MRLCARLLASIAALLVPPLLTSPAKSAEENCALKPLVTLPMTEAPSGLFTIPMTLNGRETHLVLDTGGGIRALKPFVVEELGLRRIQGDVRMLDVKGNSSLDQVRVPSVTFAGVALPEGMVFSVMAGPSRAEMRSEAEGKDSDLPKVNAGNSVEGLFTPDIFFGKADLELDFANKQMILMSNDHCKGKVVHWPAQALAVVPFLMDGNQIVFPVELDGMKVKAMMDTGASSSAVDLDTVRRKFNIDLESPDVEKEAQLLPGQFVYRKKFNILSFEGITVKNPVMSMMPNAIPKEEVTGSRIRERVVEPPAMLVGMPILRKLHIYIAFREQMLYITPASPVAVPVAPSASQPEIAPQREN